jgi:hypothetical protein
MAVRMDYTTLSLTDVETELHAIARDAAAVFGGLDARQLNWKANAESWTIAQCFDHLLHANREMFLKIDAALDRTRPRTFWQRVPLLPRMFGRLLVTSQSPEGTRKFKAPGKAAPAASAIDADIVARFAAYQREAAARVQAIDRGNAAATVMVSPFASFITYSVLDGCRLIAAHERRHFEQARRVTQAAGFPPAG